MFERDFVHGNRNIQLEKLKLGTNSLIATYLK